MLFVSKQKSKERGVGLTGLGFGRGRLFSNGGPPMTSESGDVSDRSQTNRGPVTPRRNPDCLLTGRTKRNPGLLWSRKFRVTGPNLWIERSSYPPSSLRQENPSETGPVIFPS